MTTSVAASDEKVVNMTTFWVPWIPVLSKLINHVSPNGPPTVDGWVARITFGWSVYAMVRNDNKTLILLLCYLFSTITRAYIKRSCQVSGARDFCLKLSNRFDIWQALSASVTKPPVYFLSDWSIFPNHTWLSICEKSVGNSVITKRTTVCASMSRQFNLCVTFGDRVTVFVQHCYTHTHWDQSSHRKYVLT